MEARRQYAEAAIKVLNKEHNMAGYQELKGYRDLKVYQLAYKLAMEIFPMSKAFPKEEKYSLTDQLRRSSRSVAANIAEGFRKRQYPEMFVSKLADADLLKSFSGSIAAASRPVLIIEYYLP